MHDAGLLQQTNVEDDQFRAAGRVSCELSWRSVASSSAESSTSSSSSSECCILQKYDVLAGKADEPDASAGRLSLRCDAFA